MGRSSVGAVVIRIRMPGRVGIIMERGCRTRKILIGSVGVLIQVQVFVVISAVNKVSVAVVFVFSRFE